MGYVCNVVEGVSTAVLQDELEATDGAETGDGGRFCGEGNAAGYTEEPGAYVADDRVGRELR